MSSRRPARPRAGGHLHRQAIVRPQSHPRRRARRFAGRQFQPVLLRDARDGQNRLGGGEALADAGARAAAEGQVAVAPRLGSVQPAPGLEPIRVGKETLVAVGHPGADQEHGSGRHPVAAEGEFRIRHAGDDRHRRIEAQRLLEHRVAPGERRRVILARRAPAEDGIHFGVESLRDGGVLGQQIPSPGQRHRGGLVAGDQQRDDLVLPLRILQQAGFAVAGAPQRGDQVAAAGLPAVSALRLLAQDPFDQLAAGADRLPQLAVLAGRNDRRRLERMSGAMGNVAHDGFAGVQDVLAVARKVDAVEGVEHDVQGDAQHLAVHLAHLPVAPGRSVPFCHPHHGGTVARQRAALERRVEAVPLAHPEVFVAGKVDDPVDVFAAGQEIIQAGGRPGLAARELARVGGEHALQQVGVIDEHQFLPAGGEPNQVAVVARRAGQEAERVAAEVQGVAQERQAARSGRSSGDHRP